MEPLNCTVLVVEDNPVNERVLKMILKKFGCEVSVVENGQLAVDALKDTDFDLVLMDCQMPVMDGYQATRRIRESANRTQVPIIAVTANALQGDREKCLAAGMDDYLAKPVRAPLLHETMAKWLGRSSASGVKSATN